MGDGGYSEQRITKTEVKSKWREILEWSQVKMTSCWETKGSHMKRSGRQGTRNYL